MTRRVFCVILRPGSFPLDAAEAHHVRDVMRLQAGSALELFDAGGQVADAVIESATAHTVMVRVDSIRAAAIGVEVSVASAVPKSDRADWLVEKLSELGVTRWTPLKTSRSVVHPAGEAKFDRWKRIAIEAAKQSRRVGVMAIGPLTEVGLMALEDVDAFVLSTREACRPLTRVERTGKPVVLLIGPEGGWMDEELSALTARGVREASLTTTILRIETAAIVAATIMLVK